MVARMMRWRPWPSSPPRARSKSFEARLVLRSVERLEAAAAARATAEVRWEGPPRAALRSMRRSGARRNRTREEEVKEGGGVEWGEEFCAVCSLVAHREDDCEAFQPWEISVAVHLSGLPQQHKKKTSIVGVASLNLAEFVSSEGKEMEVNIPLLRPDGSSESCPTIHLLVQLMELQTVQEPVEDTGRSIVPIPLSPSFSGTSSSEKDEPSTPRSGFKTVKILKSLVSRKKVKNTFQDDEDGQRHCSDKSDDSECMSPFSIVSLNDNLDEDVEDITNESSITTSVSYGSLATANHFEVSSYLDSTVEQEGEGLVYYSHQRPDVIFSCVEETKSSTHEQAVSPISKISLFPWRKKKAKGEPLLKKSYAEEGGDDIDFDRRQLSSSEESIGSGKHHMHETGEETSLSKFGDDQFAVGSWESKVIMSRDGNMKLSTQVFFASIDQRNERAAGGSACAVLVAVIADWFQTNRGTMPIKSQFDNLIREGSLEWRNLCQNEVYREQFPDKHFDLETVIQAEIRPLSIASGKSFIGFFQPGGTNEHSNFDFLHGAMSFDDIWEEIGQAGSCLPADGGSLIYVISWNDHFFVLMVERDAYYIIDTLGERLYEGCNQAYILKFDDSTLIHKVSSDSKSVTGKVKDNETQLIQKNNVAKEEKATGEEKLVNASSENKLVCKGKESCKEYIKNFLAAIPIRELLVDLKKGLVTSRLVHHRLQIEFHYTESSKIKAYSQPHSTEPTFAFSGLMESDSEFSSPTESDPEFLSSPEVSATFSWPIDSAADLFWPIESAAGSFFPPTMNLEVEVV